MKNEKGFSLIELTMVLAIVGVLIGLASGMVGPLMKQARLVETREIMESGIETLIGYGAANDTLPTTGNFVSTVTNPNDSWTKPLSYILDTRLTSSSGGGICGRKTTDLTLEVCPDTGCASPTKTINNVAFILISGAANYNNQTAGTQAVASATTISAYEVDVSVDGYATDMNRVEAFDDTVKWVSLDELRTGAGCPGPQLKIVSNELPYGFESTVYSTTVFADGGVPFSGGGDYKWCRQESASTGLTFSPATLNGNCLGLAEESWGAATDELTISGTPATPGTYNFTIFVRDVNDPVLIGINNDNIAKKTLVLTINMAAP
jgi:prepilin-type N-terminal cleavage/methylation domain-containing protein